MRLNDIKNQDQEKIKVPKTVQEVIPMTCLWEDGICLVGDGRYSKSYHVEDVNYAGLSLEQQKSVINGYQDVLASFKPEATTKITINNRARTKSVLEKLLKIPEKNDGLDKYREDYNRIVMNKATANNSIFKEIYITVSVKKRDITDARSFFSRVETEMGGHVRRLGSALVPINGLERVSILHDFFRPGEEATVQFDFTRSRKNGEDFRDYIVPDIIEKHDDYLKLGNRFARVLFVKGFGTFVSDRVFNEICSLNCIMQASIDNLSVPQDVAVKVAEERLMAVEDNIEKWKRRESSQKPNVPVVQLPYNMERQREDMREFLDDLNKRDKRMFLSAFTIVHSADTLEQLNADTDEIKALGTTCHVDITDMRWMQLDGLVTALPIGVRRNQIIKTLTSESLSAWMPFNSNEIQHPGGTFVGINKRSKKLIMIDRKNLLNGNSFLVGTTGSGKSMFIKNEIIDRVLKDDNVDVLVIDPEHEYGNLVKALGGEVIDISASSKTHINAMDINSEYGADQEPVVVKAEFVLSLYEQIADGVVTAKERSIIARCVNMLYNRYGIVKQTKIPTLKDLYDILLDQPEDEAADIAVKMELFTTGILDTFAQESNVDINKRIVCYDINKLSEQLRSVGMLVVLDNIWNRVSANRTKGRVTFVVFDETQLMLQHALTATFFRDSWRRIRKYGGYCTGIAQNAGSILSSEVGSAMFQNSELVVLLNQKNEDCAKLEQLMHINEEELKAIHDVDFGEGLIKVGKELISFDSKIPTDTELYKLMSTKFNEFTA